MSGREAPPAAATNQSPLDKPRARQLELGNVAVAAPMLFRSPLRAPWQSSVRVNDQRCAAIAGTFTFSRRASR